MKARNHLGLPVVEYHGQKGLKKFLLLIFISGDSEIDSLILSGAVETDKPTCLGLKSRR